MSEMLTAKQVAERLSVSTFTLDDWRARSEGPPFVRINSRNVRYPADEFERWLESRPGGGAR